MNFQKLLIHVYDSLTRVTSRRKIIQEIDGLRFLAAFPVVIQHLSERVTRNVNIDFIQGNEYYITQFITSRGFVGVYIFFIVSGFVMTIPFANYYLFNGSEITILRYFKKRFARIIPPYSIALIFLLLILLVMQYYPVDFLLKHFLASIFFMHNTIYSGWSPINPTIWTLEIQVQFYLVLPFIAFLIYRLKSTTWRRVFIIALILIIHLLQDLSGIVPTWGYFNILGNLQYFLLGIFLADIYLIEFKKEISKSYWFDFVAIVSIFLALIAWSWDHNMFSRLQFLFLLFVFFYSMFRSKLINAFLSNKLIVALGSMCFTIYLVHLPLAELFIIFTKNLHVTNFLSVNLILQSLLYLPLLVIVSVIYFIFVEKPSMNSDWIDKVFSFLSRRPLNKGEISK